LRRPSARRREAARKAAAQQPQMPPRGAGN
jgi:hypothetical protein